jgi:hypothetical protein
MGGLGLRLRATTDTIKVGSVSKTVWGEYCADVARLLTPDEFAKKINQAS